MLKKLVVLAAGAAVITAGPVIAATRSAASVSGVVVSNDHGVVLVAAKNGSVRAVHGHFTVGSRVATRNGRLGAVGTAHRALIRGVVVRSQKSVTFVSAAHRIIAIHASRTLSSAGGTLPLQPAPGTVVQTTVSIGDQGELDQEDQQSLGGTGQAQVQATVSAVGPGTVTLTVNGQPLTIALPGGLTLPASIIGSQVTLNLTFDNGGVVASEDDNGDDDGGTLTTSTSQVDTNATTTTTGTTTSGGHDHGGHDGGGDD